MPFRTGHLCFACPKGNSRISDQIRSDQSLSRVRLFVTPWIAARQASPSITNSRSSLRLTSTESVMQPSHLILCRPLLLLPPIPPCIRVFSNESTLCTRLPKYWGFSFSISPSNEHPGQISFRMDWLDLLAVQGTLKSLLEHHSSNASILQYSALWSSNSTPGHISRQNCNSKGYVHSWISRIAALFLIDKKWKQAKCPSTDEWIKRSHGLEM